MGENTIIVYDIEVNTTDGDAQENIRKALAELFRSTAYALEHNISHGSIFGVHNELRLISEINGWNQKLVLRIRRTDNE